MVNIEDVKSEREYDENQCRLVTIFEKQTALIKKYHPIEERSGLRHTIDLPVDLHDPKGQAQLKDYAWRFTEEIGEALEAFNLHYENPTHCNEELADALHFLVEFTIHAGLPPEQIGRPDLEMDGLEFLFTQALEETERDDFTVGICRDYGSLLLRTGQVIEAMSKTCNTLKNKPWKQSHMLTDIPRFIENLQVTWVQFILLCISAGMNSDELFMLYIDKNAVNQFRQRSQY